MCAINGFTFEDKKLIDTMNRVTEHRGPDGTGSYCQNGISLGHNRLSIIDLSQAGSQPMENSDGSLVISYNGEVYNFQELRKELGEYPFRSKSDTEVILAAYQKWGKDAFARLSGMFAFALFDKNSGELILVRDQSGIKPLYYAWDGTRLVFSSEIKAILEHPTITRTLNREALLHYLRVLYVPAPLTMVEKIYKLEPGHILVYKQGNITTCPFNKQKLSAPQQLTGEALRETVQAAVSRQLVSDRPVGIYLSGGLDSSIVLACASQAQGSIDTFSINFDLGKGHPRQETFSADAILARKTAKWFGARHHEVSFSGDDAFALFDQVVWHLDEPIANATSLPMVYLGAFAKQKVAVVLGGDGGDELFGGYERYRLSLLATYYRYLPAPIRTVADTFYPPLKKLDTPPGIKRFARFMFQKDREIARVLKEPLHHMDAAERFFTERFFTPLSHDFENQFMETDRRSWLVDECLARTDKASMASGLEVRVPLLDDEVIAYASHIPRQQKVTSFDTKRALKQAFRGYLPDYLFDQPKRGWFAPGGEWIKHGAFGCLADEVLSGSYYRESANLFEWREIQTMLEHHRSGREYHMVMLWALILLQAWMEKFNVRVM